MVHTGKSFLWIQVKVKIIEFEGESNPEPGDGMQVGVEPIVEVSVRFPDLFQHLHIQTQLMENTF